MLAETQLTLNETQTLHLTPPTPPPDPTHLDYQRVLSIIKRKLAPHYDHEQIALDVLMESWLNGQPSPTPAFILNRCIDAMRLHHKEALAMQELARHTSDTSVERSTDAREKVARLVKVLEPQEKKAIALRYYMDLSVDDAARQCGMPSDAFRLLVQRALYKMREAAL